MQHTIEEYHQIYYEYCLELNQYCDEDISDRAESDKYCDDLRTGTYYKWIDIENDNGQLIGFLVTSQIDCHPDADFHVAQSFVKPEYRKQGYMTKAVHEQLKKNKGIWCLLILKDNEYAYKFWNDVFKSAGYEWKRLKPVKLQNDNGDISQVAYAPCSLIGF